MQTETIPLEETHCFSSTFTQYVLGDEKLEPFYQAFPNKNNIRELIQARNFPNERRVTLSEALKKQYHELNPDDAVLKNIEALSKENAFTITTGHQLNIFTGPLYFIYKIITVINACKALNKDYPEFHFVPVYWMASEDHDFEEISYFHFEGKKISWKTDQQGAVGRFNPQELQEIAAHLPDGAAFFKEAYQEKSLADAVRSYVNHLFEDEGLVIIDADDPSLKEYLIPVIEDDIIHNTPQQLVEATSSDLEAQGFKPQVSPRGINFFYLDGDVRQRIERTGEHYQVLDTDLRYTETELRELITSHPEKFSPNVIIRPLYQETILPNLAYVGGPSELIYWLQLKAVFDHFAIPFPALMPRNFALIFNSSEQRKWHKIGLATEHLFDSSEELFAQWVATHSDHTLSFKSEIEELNDLAAKMKSSTSRIDPTLNQHIEAITRSYQNKIERAEKKLLRAEKRKHQEKRQQIEAIKETLFPGGTLQERKINFLEFYLEDPHFIQKLKDSFDPFNFEMHLLVK